jgi:hypothetical protein
MINDPRRVIMLSFIAKTAVTVLLATGCSLISMARAQDHPSYQASIPFAFYIGDTLLPAGTYLITQPAQNLLLFHNERGGADAYQLVSAKQLAGRATTGQLTFDEYGSSYFLREFSAPDKSSGTHMASTALRGRLESRTAKKLVHASSREVASNALPRR